MVLHPGDATHSPLTCGYDSAIPSTLLRHRRHHHGWPTGYTPQSVAHPPAPADFLSVLVPWNYMSRCPHWPEGYDAQGDGLEHGVLITYEAVKLHLRRLCYKRNNIAETLVASFYAAQKGLSVLPPDYPWRLNPDVVLRSRGRSGSFIQSADATTVLASAPWTDEPAFAVFASDTSWGSYDHTPPSSASALPRATHVSDFSSTVSRHQPAPEGALPSSSSRASSASRDDRLFSPASSYPSSVTSAGSSSLPLMSTDVIEAATSTTHHAFEHRESLLPAVLHRFLLSSPLPVASSAASPTRTAHGLAPRGAV